MTMTEWKLLSAAEAADRLGVPTKRFYEIAAAGLIRTVRIGRLHKVHPAELDRFVREAMER